jgi:hypothetical protein
MGDDECKNKFPMGEPWLALFASETPKTLWRLLFPCFGEAQAHASPFSMVCDMSVVQMGKGGNQTLFLVNESRKKPKKQAKKRQAKGPYLLDSFLINLARNCLLALLLPTELHLPTGMVKSL